MKLKLQFKKQAKEVDFDDSTTLEHLQEIVKETWKLQGEKLIFSGLVLKGNNRLAEYGIKDRSKLIVMGQEMVSKEESELEKLFVELEQLMLKYDNLERLVATHGDAFKKVDYMYRELNELLLQLLLKVDNIQGDESIRQKRKDLVTSINQYLDRLDTLKPKLVKWKAEL
jgi:hypothetical protein